MFHINSLKKIGTVTAIATGFAGSLLMPISAHASEDGRRNSTYALGAVTGVLAAKGQWLPAIIAGVGTAIAANNLQNDINARHDRWDYRSDDRNGRFGRDDQYNSHSRFGQDDRYNLNDRHDENFRHDTDDRSGRRDSRYNTQESRHGQIIARRDDRDGQFNRSNDSDRR